MPRAWHASAMSIAYSAKITGSLYVNATLRAARPLRRACDRLGRRLVHQRVHLARLRDVPVLAELAREVAARGAERQHARAGIEVIERLLLDRIDAEAGRRARRSSAPSRRLRAGARSRRRAGPRAAGSRADRGRTGCARRRVDATSGPDENSWAQRRRFRLALLPLGDRIAREAQVARPEVLAQSGLVLERGENGQVSGRVSQTCGRNVAR